MALDREVMQQGLQELNLKITERQLDQLANYQQLLLAWNENINLTAITTPRDIAVKHFLDSLTCLRVDDFNKAQRIIDVGTGAGFPGIPLKIARPDLELVLIDALNKRVAFLQEVAQVLGLSGVKCYHARAEEWGRNPAQREKYDLALSRAVALMPVLAEFCLPLVRTGGIFIAMKGPESQLELNSAAKSLNKLGGQVREIMTLKLPVTGDQRILVIIDKDKSTPLSYPRQMAKIKKNPL